ncbi:MAG: PfkB family carbohydrate kinase [Phenylobacterium sp.]
MAPVALILSSHVAGSGVGGGLQAAALTRLGFRTALVPTVLFGRHPGLGAPGGGPVPDALFAGQVEGLLASGLVGRADLVITGYFASAAQVETAARLLDHVAEARPQALRLVDPILGDEDRGLYVTEAVAEALPRRLVPRAGLLAPNAWELGRLTGLKITDPGSALAAAHRLGRPVLVSSVPDGADIGVLWTDGTEAWLASHPRLGQAPKGAGDLLAALFGAGLALGGDPGEVLESSVRTLAGRLAGAPSDLLDQGPAKASPPGYPPGSPPDGGDARVALRRP